MTEATHYQTMALDRGASHEEVVRQWRLLARAYHPDRFQDAATRREATLQFAAISGAYAVLGDPARRKAYDASLDLTTDPCKRCAGKGRRWVARGGFIGREAATCLDCGGSGRKPKERGKTR